MPDESRIRILRQIVQHDGADAFATKGKAPIMSDRVWTALRKIEAEGLIAMDESEAPIMQDGARGHIMGRGFVALTEAGRLALAKSST